MNNDVEAIKSRINIVDLIGEKVRLKKAGRNYFGLCPFHNEKSPSFSVNEEIQRYKCFGCGEAGDVFNFIIKTENLEFREALEFLAEKINYKLENKGTKSSTKEVDQLLSLNKLVANWYYKSLFDSQLGMDYAKKRFLDKNLVKKFGIGYAPNSYTALTEYLLKNEYKNTDLEKYSLVINRKGQYIDKFRNRLMFAIFDEKGRIVGFAGRFIGKDKGEFKTPKYLNSSETLLFYKSKLLFGLYQAKDSIRKMKFAIVCEGQFNVISSYRVGVENIVASLGTSLTEHHLKLLNRYTDNIYFAFDKDSAGKKALLRAIEMSFTNDISIKVINWDLKNGGDPDELITYDPKLWIEAVNNPLDPIEYLFKEFSNKYKEFNSDNVNTFLNLIMKLLSFHTNKVKVEYYLKFLSEKFDITLNSIQDLNQKTTRKIEFKEEKESENFVIKDMSKSIFNKIFSLILQNWETQSSLIFLIDRDLLPDNFKELYDCLVLFTDEINLNVIREEISEENRELFDELILMHYKIDESKSVDEHLSKLIQMSSIEFKKGLIAEWKRNPEDEGLISRINKLLNSR